MDWHPLPTYLPDGLPAILNAITCTNKSINDQEEDKDNPPKIKIEGPFGGGNQDWYKFEVAVMVGGDRCR